MSTFADYYGDSYPPELWETPAAPVGAARSVQADEGPAATITVVAGTPGSYLPDLKAADRPRNITELRERATPVAPFPWLPGQHVLVGTTGKRAHWDGEDWQYNAAPAVTSTDAAGTVPAGTVDDA